MPSFRSARVIRWAAMVPIVRTPRGGALPCAWRAPHPAPTRVTANSAATPADTFVTDIPTFDVNTLTNGDSILLTACGNFVRWHFAPRGPLKRCHRWAVFAWRVALTNFRR